MTVILLGTNPFVVILEKPHLDPKQSNSFICSPNDILLCFFCFVFIFFSFWYYEYISSPIPFPLSNPSHVPTLSNSRSLLFNFNICIWHRGHISSFLVLEGWTLFSCEPNTDYLLEGTFFDLRRHVHQSWIPQALEGWLFLLSNTELLVATTGRAGLRRTAWSR